MISRKNPSAAAPSRRPIPARSNIAVAVALGLASLALAPAALASDTGATPDSDTISRALSDAFASPSSSGIDVQARITGDAAWHHRLWQRVPAPAAPRSGPAAAAPSANAPGDAADPDSWIDGEFQADWGLEAINAHHAYARGLSGAGIRLALLDSGAGFDHPEFAGKDHRSLVMADLLADGSRCSDATVLAGPDACFYSEGDRVAISGEYYDPVLANYFPDPANDHLWGNTFFRYDSHGTHVAGTIAANRDGSGMHGVAFGADLSSARLFNDSLLIVDDWCYFLNDCLQFGTSAGSTAFAYMYEQVIAQGVRAMNHSWGYTYAPSTPEEVALYHEALMGVPDIAATFEAMADASRRSGMIQVVAAGNSAPNSSPDSSPHATLPATLPMIFPDIEQYWVSVVNVNELLELSSQSMRCGVTAEWCIAAPGSWVTSTVFDGDDDITGDWGVDADGNLRYEYGEFEPGFGYADYSGTSMAAPHVTGALGLLFERFPYLTGAQVRDVMLTTATDLGAEGVDDIYGWGLLDLKKAIEGPGLLRVDTEVVMDRMAGGRKVWEGGAWDDWTNDIAGPGHLTKAGPGWLRLSGDNSFAGSTVTAGILELDGDNALTGDVRITGGALLLNGSLSGSDLAVDGGLAVINGTVLGGGTRVEAGGTLAGGGTLADTWVGGTIAPGNSIGTLTIDGDYVQAAGSVFEAELLPPATSDLLYVTGTATIEGGTLRAIRSPGTYLLGQSYRILTAEGGLSGAFDTLDDTGLSPFLSLALLYGANGVNIDVTRGASLASAAMTLNQFATATAVDGLAIDQGLLVPLTQLDAADAMAAIDQLSGEAHASGQAVLLDSSRMIRNAALARAAHGQDAFTAQRDGNAATGAWIDVNRQGGHIAGDGNAARVQSSSSNVLVGIDHDFAGWRVGAFGGTGRTDASVRDRNARLETDSVHLGVYASRAWGPVGLRAGVSHASYDVDAERSVAFQGFSDAPLARYDADAWQGFVEAGWRLDAGAWSFEPYLQYAHVELDTDGFAEQGDAAALNVDAATARADLTTAGMRFAVALRRTGQEQSWLSLRGNLGYRHAGGDQVQAIRARWEGGDAFTVRSPAVTDEAMLVEVGLAARTSANSLFEVGYSGQLSDDARDHGANARFSVQF